MRSRIDNVCYECAERYPACHDYCERYKAAKAKWDGYRLACRSNKAKANEYDLYKLGAVTKGKIQKQKDNRR